MAKFYFDAGYIEKYMLPHVEEAYSQLSIGLAAFDLGSLGSIGVDMSKYMELKTELEKCKEILFKESEWLTHSVRVVTDAETQEQEAASVLSTNKVEIKKNVINGVE